MLHISNFFAHFLMCCLINQTALRTLELYVVQLIVVLSYLAALTDLILYYFKLLYEIVLMKLDRMIFFAGA